MKTLLARIFRLTHLFNNSFLVSFKHFAKEVTKAELDEKVKKVDCNKICVDFCFFFFLHLYTSFLWVLGESQEKHRFSSKIFVFFSFWYNAWQVTSINTQIIVSQSFTWSKKIEIFVFLWLNTDTHAHVLLHVVNCSFQCTVLRNYFYLLFQMFSHLFLFVFLHVSIVVCKNSNLFCSIY